MLRLLCNESQASGRVTRREWLRISGLAGLGALTVGAPSRADRAGRGPSFGRARSVIVVFTGGGMSQLDTLDPKPDAPAEIRGEFRTLPTAGPRTRPCA